VALGQIRARAKAARHAADRRFGGGWPRLALAAVLAAGIAAGAAGISAQAADPAPAAASAPAGTSAGAVPGGAGGGAGGGASTCPSPSAGATELAAALARRERGLEEREQTIKDREAAIAAAEAKIEGRLKELEAVRARISEQLDRTDTVRTERVTALVAMIEANRAPNVAPMFGALDAGLAVEVLDKMNRTKAGKLLAELPPAQAAALAMRMTRPLDVKK